jgi:hypothetical protein
MSQGAAITAAVDWLLRLQQQQHDPPARLVFAGIDGTGGGDRRDAQVCTTVHRAAVMRAMSGGIDSQH